VLVRSCVFDIVGSKGPRLCGGYVEDYTGGPKGLELGPGGGQWLSEVHLWKRILSSEVEFGSGYFPSQCSGQTLEADTFHSSVLADPPTAVSDLDRICVLCRRSVLRYGVDRPG
jgi:hypothetical protein